MMNCKLTGFLLATSLTLLAAGLPAVAGPDLQIDTQESVILIPQGTVSSNTLEISNDGDSTLTWTLCDSFKGKVVKDFANPWTSAYSMRYDATRDCLWLAYYYSSELKKVSTSNGSVLATKNMGSNCTRPYCIEMDGAFLWAPDYANTRFVKFNLDNMSVAATVPFPSGWTYCYGLGIGDGKMFATRYNYDYRKNIYRLNPSSGAVQQTFSNVEYFYWSGNHIGYGDGAIWFGAYYKPKNVIKKFDPALGKIRSEIEMPDWGTTYCSIRDQALDATDGRMWALTYRHDYHETSESKYWIHLLDVGAMKHLTESADSGSIAATSSVPVGVVFDATSAESGIHRVGIRISSNGGTKEKPYVFVVHAPGVNSAPTADAGPDQTLDITEPTMAVTLDGSGSSDPDGDELVYLWTRGSEELSTKANPTIELGPGVHDIKLTVSDLRGGTATDTVRITLLAPDIEVDDLYVPIPEGGGTANGTVTVRNNGDRTLDWSVSDTLKLDASAIIREFEVTWKSSYSAYAYPYTMAYDSSRDCLWVGYYYDDEVGRINANNGSVIETKALGGTHRVYALDMEGADLWIADRSAKKFQKFNMDTLANTQTINHPWGTANGPTSLARDSGQFYASQYYAYDICKLDAGSGALQKTHDVGERQYYYNHHDAIDGTVWYTRYNTPRTRIHSMDGTSGNLQCTLDMGHWNENGQIYDLSFVNSTQCWMLTYNVKSDGKRWAHLVDLSAGQRFSKSAVSGIVSAGAAATFDVSYDTTGLAKGLYPVLLTFASNDPDEPVYEKEIYFLVHEDAPNNPPVADAGPDITRETLGVTAPFILNNLSGEGSSDPDGDPLRMTWSWTDTGEPLVLSEKGVIELGGGSHGLTLTVEDYRGGVDTDEMVFTVNAGAARRDSPQYNGPNSDNTHVATNWLENWPPIERWRVKTDQGYGHAVVLDGRMYTWAPPRCFDLDTGELIWTGDVRSYPKGDPGNTYTTFDKVWPVVDEVHVYTVDGGGVLCAWDKETGELVWYAKEPDNTSIPSPYVDGDLVFGDRGAHNKFTGEKVWTYSTGWGCPFGFDYEGRRWLQLNGYMYNMATGEKGMHLAYPDGWGMAPTLFESNKWFDIQSVRVMGGSTLWTVPSNKDNGYMTQYTRPAIVDGYAYFPHCHDYRCGAGPLKCVRLTDGQLMWNGPGTIGVGAADGLLVLGVNQGINVIKHDPTHVNYEGRETYRIDNLSIGGYGVQPFVVGKRIYAKCGGYMVCLDCAFSAPVVNNGLGAAWDGNTRKATLRGDLVNTGGKPTRVFVYWGATDGSTNAAAWDDCVSLGSRESGWFSAVVSGLAEDSVYYYRCFASNEVGMTWAPSTERFTTPAPGTVEVTDGLVVHWTGDEIHSDRVLPDMSGNGNHATAVNGFWTTNGPVGGAVKIQSRGASCVLNTRLAGDWSMAFWLNLTAAGDEAVLLAYDVGFRSSVRWKDNLRNIFRPYTPGTWAHLAYVQKDGMRYVYNNGIKIREWDPGAPAQDTYRYVYLGGGTLTTYEAVDDFRLYRRALSGTEVNALVAMGNVASGLPSATLTSLDDAEEAADGTVALSEEELTLGGTDRLAGLRFAGLNIPRGATITAANIQFGAGADPGVADAALWIACEATDNSVALSGSAHNLSSRSVTAVRVPWQVSVWTAGASAEAQMTPNLAAIVQAVVDRPGWTSGNAITFLVKGAGERIADAAEKSGGKPAALSVTWNEATDLDCDAIPDTWERTSADAPPSEVAPGGDADGDGVVNYQEFFMGDVAAGSGEAPLLSLETHGNGEVVACVNARAADQFYFPGMNRYYTLMHLDALPTSGSTTQTLWHEDFSLPDGTTNDTGETAWSIADPYRIDNPRVDAGAFRFYGRMMSDSTWVSEVIDLDWKRSDISLWVSSRGGETVKDGYLRVLCVVNGGGERELASYADNFGDKTVTLNDVVAETIQLKVRAKAYSGSTHYILDNVKVTHTIGPDWPVVPGVSNVLVTTDRMIEHTNNTPAKTGFYRLKTRLE